MCRSCKSGKSSIPFYKKISELLKANGSFSHLEQRSSHIADHVMQKSIPFHGQEQPAPLFFQVAAEHVPDGACIRCIRFGKTGEVVLAPEQVGGCDHLLKVDRVWIVKIFPRQMRRQYGSKVNLIPVDL